MRKSPRQQRASATVEVILDTAAQVLQSDGEEGLTTNRIAERSGYSIGTLYQYFSNKQAIIAALAERERRAVVAAIMTAMQEARPGNVETALRTAVHALIHAFARRRRARRIIVLTMLRHWQGEPNPQGADQVGRLLVALAAQYRSAEAAPVSDIGAFVLTRAILGVVRAAVLEESPYLETKAFEDEVVRLARSFLNV